MHACVATQLEAGHAENALPQRARATVNCRILPDESMEEVVRTLTRVIGDDQIKIIPKGEGVLSPPSPINPEVMRNVEALAAEMWPGVPVIPTMSSGATDSRFLRNIGMLWIGVGSNLRSASNADPGMLLISVCYCSHFKRDTGVKVRSRKGSIRRADLQR